MVTVLRSVPFLDSLKFQFNAEDAAVFSLKAGMVLDGFAEMGTVGVGERTQQPTTDGNLRGLDFVYR